MKRLAACYLFYVAIAGVTAGADEPRTSFRVTYVASGAVYLDGGRQAGLSEGFHLTVKRRKPGAAEMEAQTIGEIVIVSVAGTSAVGEIGSHEAALAVGDTATLSQPDAESVRVLLSSTNTHKYPQLVSFTEGDPLDEEARKYVSRPPLREINHLRGRIAFEQSSTADHASGGASSTQEGVVLRADMTRLGGTFWNFTGYWRGRLDSRGGSSQTLTDVLDRTYHIGLYYNNPDSNYVLGFGRLYLPWAPSLNTIDGGYFARKLGSHTTVGIFGGSTPDPSAWNYNPNRQMSGAFVNWDTGSFEAMHFSSTAGLSLTRVHWHPERQFLFIENSLSYARVLSVYHDLEADAVNKNIALNVNGGPQISRSFLTVRIQANKALSFDVNHNYFRGLPTFDTRLLGTGLLDKFLFQGLSGSVRVDLPYSLNLYTSLGRNRRDTDTKASLNQMYGLTVRHIWFTGARADFRYSRFASSFGSGSYETVTLSKDILDRLRVELLGGEQDLRSTLTQDSRARFITSSADWFFTTHYSIGGGLTMYRGRVQNYDQIYFNLGYRF